MKVVVSPFEAKINLHSEELTDSIKKKSLLMLPREIIFVYSENHTGHIKILRGQNTLSVLVGRLVGLEGK